VSTFTINITNREIVGGEPGSIPPPTSPTGDPNPKRGIDFPNWGWEENDQTQDMTNTCFHFTLSSTDYSNAAAPWAAPAIPPSPAQFQFSQGADANWTYGYMYPGTRLTGDGSSGGGFFPYANGQRTQADVWMRRTASTGGSTTVVKNGGQEKVPIPTITWGTAPVGTQAVLRFSSESDPFFEVPVQIKITR